MRARLPFLIGSNLKAYRAIRLIAMARQIGTKGDQQFRDLLAASPHLTPRQATLVLSWALASICEAVNDHKLHRKPLKTQSEASWLVPTLLERGANPFKKYVFHKGRRGFEAAFEVATILADLGAPDYLTEVLVHKPEKGQLAAYLERDIPGVSRPMIGGIVHDRYPVFDPARRPRRLDA